MSEAQPLSRHFRRSFAKGFFCTIALHSWEILCTGTPAPRIYLYHERCKNCGKERHVAWLSR